MVPRASRIATAALALLVLLGLERCTCNCSLVTDSLKAVTVDSNSVASPDETKLYILSNDTVAWVPFATGHTLTIRFAHDLYPVAAKGLPPFANGTNNQDQTFTAYSATIYSPAINPDLLTLIFNGPNPPTQLIYKYDQTVDGHTKDGRIIIMKQK